MVLSVEFYNDDYYKQMQHPVERPELIQQALTDLDEEIATMPKKQRASWERAKKTCAPELVDDGHKLMFLRCEVFNIKMAASRLVKYWDKRIELYGEKKAFLPLTLNKDGASRDDTLPLEMGVIGPGGTDKAGRCILVADPTKIKRRKYDRSTMVRAIWYVVHAMLLDAGTANDDDDNKDGSKEAAVAVQQKGIVLLTIGVGAKFWQFDSRQEKENIDSLREFLPLRMAAIHFCHPPGFFHLVLPIIKMLAGPILGKVIYLQSGSFDDVLRVLEEDYGIPKEYIPVALGGGFSFDQIKWLEERQNAGL